MYSKSALIILSIIAFILTGCVSWIEPDGPVSKKLYSISIPNHWLVINQSSNQLAASRNGPFLESVKVDLHTYATELPNSERTLSSDLLPLELVEAIITDLRASEYIFEVELISSSPVEKSGKPGYRLEATYRTEEGLRMGRIEDGYITDQGIIRVVYEAPLRHYFDAHRSEALWMMGTLQIKD